MTFSSEIENCKRANHQTPIFMGDFSRSRLKISSEIEVFKRKLENFKRKLEILKRSSEIDFFQDSGPLGKGVRRLSGEVPRGLPGTPNKNCLP